MTAGADPFRHLTSSERDCLERYCRVLRARLGENLERLVLFKSAARGDMWMAGSVMHSDIDLLVVTATALPERVAEQLVNETYRLFLECGRQIGPQFRTATALAKPADERSARFAENVARDGVDLPMPEIT